MSPVPSKFRLQVNVADSGTWLSSVRRRGSPDRYSLLFVSLMEAEIVSLQNILDEDPSWLERFVTSSPSLLGLARIDEPGRPTSFWEISVGVRGEFLCTPSPLSEYEAFTRHVAQYSGERQESRRSLTLLAHAMENQADYRRREDLVASQQLSAAYDADVSESDNDSSPGDNDVALDDLQLIHLTTQQSKKRTAEKAGDASSGKKARA